MKLRLLIFVFVCMSALPIYAQGIVVDTLTYSNEQLVKNVLLPSGCIKVSNFLWSSRSSVGYFNKASSNFAIDEGVVIRSGLAKYSEGQYSGNLLSSQVSTGGDTFLQNLSNQSGQTDQITDVAFLQFDFIPISNKFSFDFLFASNEYGEYQCGYSDVFAFILTDLSTGVQTNLAVVPGTTNPVSVKTIRNNTYNASCSNSNASLFGEYNVTTPANSDTNMRGETRVLNAASSVTPYRNYRIRMVIGDYKLSNFDSAVFIKGGSFQTILDLGSDQAICDGETITLDSTLDNTFTFEWQADTVIQPSTLNNYVVSLPGTYQMTATSTNSTCVIQDQVVIIPMVTNSPQNLYACYTTNTTSTYNLTLVNPTALGLDDAIYDIIYYLDMNDAVSNSNALTYTQAYSYVGTHGQTVYIRVKKSGSGSICTNVMSFDLLMNADFTIATPYNLDICESQTSIDLSLQLPTLANGVPVATYYYIFYKNQADATANQNPIDISQNFTFPVGSSSLDFFVRVGLRNAYNCYKFTQIHLIIHPLPPVDSLSDQIVCSAFTLPPITNGSYFSAPLGIGPITLPFTVTDTSTIHIYNGPDQYGCANESEFQVTVIEKYIPPSRACGVYKVPSPPKGDFFTAPGGGGQLIPPGTQFTADTTIYYYAVIDGVVCKDIPVSITIAAVPTLNPVSDVVRCNSYTLPPLARGSYFTLPDAAGTILGAGTVITYNRATLPGGATVVITMPLTLYVNYYNGTCSAEVNFKVNIIEPTQFQAVTQCGPYTLPAIAVGGYYTQPNGGGLSVDPAVPIAQSTTVYYFVTTTSGINCTAPLNYSITINPIPALDTFASYTSCGPAVLPNITNGHFYSEANGLGTQFQNGKVILTTTTIYTYVSNGICTQAGSFKITVLKPAEVDTINDEYPCTANTYTLGPLAHGSYFTASNGGGQPIPVNTLLSVSQTIYIFSQPANATECANESFFTVHLEDINVGAFTDVQACDSYTLPPLTIGNYFYNTGGVNPIPTAGLTLNQTTTVYVYAEKGVREICKSEAHFTVNISATPQAPSSADIELCGSYTLPTLTVGFYNTGTLNAGTAYAQGALVTQTTPMYIYAVSPTNAQCHTETRFDIVIHPRPIINVADGSICYNPRSGVITSPFTTVTGIDPQRFTVQWVLGGNMVGTGPSYQALQAGDYTVNTIKLQPEVGADCNYASATFHVDQSSPGFGEVVYSEYFSETANVNVVNVSGFGIYEFQLDNGSFQSSAAFNDLPTGYHEISIKDVKFNCGITKIPFHVIYYPHYFTPNGDGLHDTWNLFDLAFQPNAIISIFDRYGKLMTQLKPNSVGWDGNYDGQPMPATDYWFTVDYTFEKEKRVFKSHFSLKR
ncbi:MAG: hypothetical protein CFE24_08470 [Flavobacterium sp. BFFFF2]|nr:MAG: hypothetical protein CFE24_08470 [Flavobacterium sp. BFFFF2]